MTSIPKETGINSVPSERGDNLVSQSIGIRTDHKFLHTPSLSIQVCDKDAPVQQTLTRAAVKINRSAVNSFIQDFPSSQDANAPWQCKTRRALPGTRGTSKRLPEGKVQK